MLNFLRAKHSRFLVWTLLVLLVIGLAGFGIGNSGALSPTGVATVGDRTVTNDAFARALDQEMRTLSRQLGRGLTVAEARQYGIDRMVLSRLINDAALDSEAETRGLSVGDATVRDQILDVPSFKTPDGKFDREAYEYTLRQNGLEPADFEAELRREAAREMIASGLQSAVATPAVVSRTILDHLGERRTFDWLRVTPANLAEPVPAPTEEQIAEEYKAHPERYTSPEIRKITYASITPEVLAGTIEVPEADLKAAYDASGARFNTPERRLLDRIGFATEADAAAAKARLDAGTIDFDALATERGLTPAQTDQGTVAASALEPGAREAVFGATGPGVVGPVPSALGPSLYRINAILAASNTPYETAREELRKERALKLAADKIAADTAAIQDLVASGATLEEIDAETELVLGTVDLDPRNVTGIAADQAFADLARETGSGEQSDLITLTGGGVAVLRVDEIQPPALVPLDKARADVVAFWTADETARRLAETAKGFAAELGPDLTFEALATRLGVAKQTAGPLTRGDTLDGTPPALITDIFAAAAGGTVVVPEAESAIIAQLAAIEAFDPTTERNKAILANAETQLRTQVADDVLALFTASLRNSEGLSIHQNQIDAVLTRFP